MQKQKVEKKPAVQKVQPKKQVATPSKIEMAKKEVAKRVEQAKKEIIKEKVKEEPKAVEMALKPVKERKEKKIFNIFQLFKDKERKKRKEILNRLNENKKEDYETISTKTKLSKGSIAVDDVDANELDPLIHLYRDSNTKLRNRIKQSQM